MIGRPPVPVLDRLIAHLDMDTSACWLWTASTRKGYGQIRVRGVDGEWTVRDAHCVSFEELVGPIPAGLVLDHLCRVTTCVNPMHLEPVTQRVNVERGLIARGKVAVIAPARPASAQCDFCAVTFEMNKVGRPRRFCSDDCRVTFWNFRRAA